MLVPNVANIVDPLADLISRARDREDVDVIYVNDNYGDFTADFEDLVNAALDGERSDLVSPDRPRQRAAGACSRCVTARSTPARSRYLLRRLETQHLIITGQVTEQCILYSALDAYVRHFSFIVPPDCVASIDPELGDAALTMMDKNMHAELVPAEKCLR